MRHMPVPALRYTWSRRAVHAVDPRVKVLIDRNIEINAITCKTVLAPQVVRWGGRDQMIHAAQRVHFPPRRDESFRRAQLPWLATLCNFAKHGKLQFFATHEMRMEKLRQKGRCEGYMGLNLLRGVPVKTIPCPAQRIILVAQAGSIGVTEKEQMEFFRSIRHPKFLQIRSATGDAHIDDAFHLWAADEAGLDVFLTMDQRFWRVVNQKKKAIGRVIPVMTPKELGEHLNAQPTDMEKLAAEIDPFS